MNCNDARPLLNLMCDDELEAKDLAHLLEHLNVCGECTSLWNETEHLHNMFQQERGKVVPPKELTASLQAMLAAEELQARRAPRNFPVSLSKMAAAAAVIVSITCIDISMQKTQSHKSANDIHAASADGLISELADSANEQVSDKIHIDSRLGFAPKYIHLPDWKMERMAVRVLQSNVPVAKFDLIRQREGHAERMTCYQGLQGSIIASTATHKQIAGRTVSFGTNGQLNYALWSQNGRDYLIVSQLPQKALEDVVSGA